MRLEIFKNRIKHMDEQEVTQLCVTYLKDRCIFIKEGTGMACSKLLDIVADVLGVEKES